MTDYIVLTYNIGLPRSMLVDTQNHHHDGVYEKEK
jgi:hypothetical protein